MEAGKPITAKFSTGSSDGLLTAFYGFSDKPFYDRFCAAAQRDLRPYPLVKGFLRTRIDDQAGEARYIVVDAVEPSTARVEVASLEAVLASIESNSKSVGTISVEAIPPRRELI